MDRQNPSNSHDPVQYPFIPRAVSDIYLTSRRSPSPGVYPVRNSPVPSRSNLFLSTNDTKESSQLTPPISLDTMTHKFSSSASNESRSVNLQVLDPGKLMDGVTSLVKNRSGSVLARNTILKMDHFPQGLNPNLELNLEGAPNFRMVDLNVFGVAQPTKIGLSTILAVLNCHPSSNGPRASSTWFSTREEPLVYINGNPHCLHSANAPLQPIRAFVGMKSNRLEQMEERLKADASKEAARSGGLLLVHREIYSGSVVPCWIAADQIQTPREVFESFQKQGYRVSYFRIPISPDQAPEDDYLDRYVEVIKKVPVGDSLVFSCGMGATRTTFGQIVALIIRRAQTISLGHPDPFPIPGYFDHNFKSELPDAVLVDNIRGLEEAEEARMQNRALLRVVHVLEKGLSTPLHPRSAIEFALSLGPLISNLKRAIRGNYQWILSLVAVLESGAYSKRLLDAVLDSCEAVINLREDILLERIRGSALSASTPQATGSSGSNPHLRRAMTLLERYFFLLAFTSYVNESPSVEFSQPFSSWIRQRTEIWSMLEQLRRGGPRLDLFRPVEDLSAFSGGDKGMAKRLSVGQLRREGVWNEVESFVVKRRAGVVLSSQTILKIDHWRPSTSTSNTEEEVPASTPISAIPPPPNIDGASNFRRVPHTHIYGVAQPTLAGIKNVLRAVSTDRKRNSRAVWINLREEPLVYINGTPYVLRFNNITLRNIRQYSGITSSRLELLEGRLKEDVLAEIAQYDGKILLHRETPDGLVVPVWEEVEEEDVLTVREMMDRVVSEVATEFGESGEDQSGKLENLQYFRVPVTAETVLETKDFDDLRRIVGDLNLSCTGIILNCQVGRGRSTLGTAAVTLLIRWLQPLKATPLKDSGISEINNYAIIHSLLRVIKNGLEVKKVVDEVIDQCGYFVNIRKAIEELRMAADEEADPGQKKTLVKKGIAALERYFLLVCFQSYLAQTDPGMIEGLETFQSWMERHQELDTILNELRRSGMEGLVPVEKLFPGDGLALSSEVLEVVNHRRGNVLTAQTIIKHDAFPGVQKMALPERVEGAPNFRRVPLELVQNCSLMGPGMEVDFRIDDMDRIEKMGPPFVCGCAMPSKDAIEIVLKRMNAGIGGSRSVIWTCLREEPVIYVNKKPYVLRLFKNVLANLITTGITRHRVERMEERMKEDVLNELRLYNGRLLLHDEEMLPGGGYSVIPIWETVKEEDIETPKEVFQSILQNGYCVDYLRIPITDEQAPIPDVFDQLIDRLKGFTGSVDALFNCQAGRGRTTTGMVIACLIRMICHNDTSFDMQSSYLAESPTSRIASSTSSNTDHNDNDTEELNRQRYLNGEYKIVMQLVSILNYGKLAKRLADRAIDLCQHMQNLRRAIYDFKLRVEGADIGAKGINEMQEVGLNYLIRYFYMIVFADYLLEEMSEVSRDSDDELDEKLKNSRKVLRFTEWLKDRREITNIIRMSNQDFS